MTSTPFYQSKTFSTLLAVMGIVTLALIIFSAGVFVGYQRADNSYRWGENYYRNFLGDKRPPPAMMDKNEFFNSHGLFGTIIQLDSTNIIDNPNKNGSNAEVGFPRSLVVKDRENMERIVVLSSETVIRRNRDSLTWTDLKLNDQIIVIGTPDSTGKIEAKLIRLGLPPPPPLDFIIPNTDRG